jgi:hypothetical protein
MIGYAPHYLELHRSGEIEQRAQDALELEGATGYEPPTGHVCTGSLPCMCSR